MVETADIKEKIALCHEIQGYEFQHDTDAIFSEYKQKGENISNITIKILSIAGGCGASLAFVGFLALGGLFDSPWGLIIFGLVCISGALVINRKYDILIIDTFSISVFLIGYILFGLGLGNLKMGEDGVSLLIASIALVSLIFTSHYILAFLSVLIFSACCLTLILSHEMFQLLHLYIGIYASATLYWFTQEHTIITKNSKLSKLYDPIRIGLVISLLFGLFIIGVKDLLPISENYFWISSVVFMVAILYIVRLSMHIHSYTNKIELYLLCLLVTLPSVLSPAILGSLFILILCFLVRYKTGFVIGVVALVYFISQYYYDLSFDLLTKSIMMMTTGILCLVCYFLIEKKLTKNEKN